MTTSGPPACTFASGQTPIRKAGVIRAVVLKRPLEDTAVKPLDLRQIRDRELDIIDPTIVFCICHESSLLDVPES
jgi:hypothetical protein